MYSRLLKTLAFGSGAAIGIGMGYKIVKPSAKQRSASNPPTQSTTENSKPAELKNTYNIKELEAKWKKWDEERRAEELDDMIRSNHDGLINEMLSRRASR